MEDSRGESKSHDRFEVPITINGRTANNVTFGFGIVIR